MLVAIECNQKEIRNKNVYAPRQTAFYTFDQLPRVCVCNVATQQYMSNKQNVEDECEKSSSTDWH